jgi:hypothetical protein
MLILHAHESTPPLPPHTHIVTWRPEPINFGMWRLLSIEETFIYQVMKTQMLINQNTCDAAQQSVSLVVCNDVE